MDAEKMTEVKNKNNLLKSRMFWVSSIIFYFVNIMIARVSRLLWFYISDIIDDKFGLGFQRSMLLRISRVIQYIPLIVLLVFTFDFIYKRTVDKLRILKTAFIQFGGFINIIFPVILLVINVFAGNINGNVPLNINTVMLYAGVYLENYRDVIIVSVVISTVLSFIRIKRKAR